MLAQASSSRLFKLIISVFVVVIIFLVVTSRNLSPTVVTNQKYRNVKNFQISSDVVNEVNTGWDLYDTSALDEDPFNMPGAYMKDYIPASVNNSYCKFNYEIPFNLQFKSKDWFGTPELGKESIYRILYNATEAYRTSEAEQITLATHLTANFAHFIPELLKHWDGLISVAAFVPDLDAAYFLEQINQYCYCEPEMHRVSIHLITIKTLLYSRKDISFERPETCIIQNPSKLKIITDLDDSIIYPINVARNVARTSALTKYVLLADIELVPSKDLAREFLKMMETYQQDTKEVFVLPMFEVESTEDVPETKSQLLDLLEKNKAVFFHKMICPHCGRFPGMIQWMDKKSFNSSEPLKPLVSVKREGEYFRWEPVYIGTNEEPLFSEWLSWEGIQDKMAQSVEMCLQNYTHSILNNAFLCHWPGIKTRKLSQEEWRTPYIEENQKSYEELIKKFTSKYKLIPGCKALEYPVGKKKKHHHLIRRV